MKTLLNIILTLTFFNIYSQEGVEVPLNTLSFDVQSGTYIKDFDNVFNPFIGTWYGNWENKSFTLILEKSIKQKVMSPDGFYFYEDRIIGKYLVADSISGSILYSTTNITNYEDFQIVNVGFPKNGRFELMFTDNNNCFNSMKIFLKNITNTPNQIKYSTMLDEFWVGLNCPYSNRFDIPIPIPNIPMILTKQ